MSINNIQLNAGQLVKLYGKTLVLAGNGPEKSGKASVPPEPPKAAAMPVSVPAAGNQTPVVPTPSPVSQPAAPAPVKLLGNFAKKILLLVHYPDHANLPEEQLSFLTNILNACKLTANEVGILNTARHPGITYEALQTQLNPACFILFGMPTTAIQAPVRIPDFQVQPLGAVSILSSPALDKMNIPGDEGKQLKGQLWLSLKKIFNL